MHAALDGPASGLPQASPTQSTPVVKEVNNAPSVAAASSSQLRVFLAGASAGLVEGVSVQPLEMLATRCQINQGARLKLIPTLREILREGGVRQLYRGGLPEIAAVIPRSTATLSTLEFSQRFFRRLHGGELPTHYAYLSGTASGVAETLAYSPFQVIKVRLMAKEHLGLYKNSVDAFFKIVANEGPMALTIGMVPCLMRMCVWNTIYYGTMQEIEASRKPLESQALNLARTGATGMAVGVFATCFNIPFDVVKSRFQSQLPGQRKYTGLFQAMATIFREEGPGALYKGFVPRALRLGFGQTIGLMTFQASLKVMGATGPEI